MNILTTTSAPIIWLILIVVLIVAEVQNLSVGRGVVCTGSGGIAAGISDGSWGPYS